MAVKRSTAEALVRIAARALGKAGLAHAYGHCSQRLDDDSFLVCAARPMGLITDADEGTVVPVDGPLPGGVLGEVGIHQSIYARRADIGGICRTMPPNVMALSTLGKTPRVRHGFGTYFAPGMPLWNDPQLVRSADAAAQVGELLGTGAAVVMRGNGLVTAGDDIRDAVVLNWYAEDAARVELAVLSTGETGIEIDSANARRRATKAGRIFERMWEYLTHGDPELDSLQDSDYQD
ncbi:MAG: class II aldolase/adducin family protein [Proteobacteria bacterium]|nr:class II aldolase/adducin family protein [Pseudomonadota bacterium]